jgi:hypothetical protein
MTASDQALAGVVNCNRASLGHALASRRERKEESVEPQGPQATERAKATPLVEGSRRQWGERITARWKDSVEAIIAVGKLLLTAKADLAHGDFEAMVRDDLPFKERTAERLMAIASNKFLANPAHVSLLPASWATLYQLSRLPDELLGRALSEGAIHPEVHRKDIARWVAPRRMPAPWDLDEALGRLAHAVDVLIEHWPPGEQAREALARRLIALGEQLLKGSLGPRRPARAAARRPGRLPSTAVGT